MEIKMFQDFDPVRDVMFRGKPLAGLTEPELREALTQALQRVRFLEETRPHQAYAPVNYNCHVPFPPKMDFTSR